MISGHLQRAQILIEQERFEQAKTEILRALQEEPSDPIAHSLLALAELNSGNAKQALEKASQAVSLGPDNEFAHYVLALVHLEMDKPKKAEAAVREALRLQPEDPDYCAILAAALAMQGRWRESLQAAEAGLQEDAEHQGCINARAQALSILGRREEARAAAGEALAIDPEDVYSQIHAGYVHLRQGRHREALGNFREALRVDPGNSEAREGVIEALRARFPVYKLPIGWSVWLARLTPGAQWAVIIGLWLGARVLRGVAKQNPEWQPYLFPILGLYGLFVIFTWIGPSLVNVTLFTHPLGRMALSKRERIESVWVAASLVAALMFGLISWMLNNESFGISAIFFGIAMFTVGLCTKLESVPRLRSALVWTLGPGFWLLGIWLAFFRPQP